MRNIEQINTSIQENNSEFKGLVAELEKRFSLALFSEYDPEIFEVAVVELTKAFREAEGESKRQLLLDRFFDAFAPSKNTPYSKFYEEYAMRPLELVDFEYELQEEGRYQSNINLIDHKLAKSTLLYPLKVQQYGPSTIYNQPPGSQLLVPLSEQDIIASTDFSSCRAVLGVNQRGEGMFSHITYSSEENKLIERLQQIFGDGDLYYAYPFEDLKKGAPEREIENRDRTVEEFQLFAQEHGLIPIRYSEVSGRLYAENQYDIRGTTISLSSSGIHIVGSDIEYLKKSGLSSSAVEKPRFHILKEETRQDISFVKEGVEKIV